MLMHSVRNRLGPVDAGSVFPLMPIAMTIRWCRINKFHSLFPQGPDYHPYGFYGMALKKYEFTYAHAEVVVSLPPRPASIQELRKHVLSVKPPGMQWKPYLLKCASPYMAKGNISVNPKALAIAKGVMLIRIPP